MIKVALVTSHPVQYQVPWVRKLAATPDIEITVFYAMIPDAAEQGREFGVAFKWDIPLLGGYEHVVMNNVAKTPSVTQFGGCDTPEVAQRIRDGGFDAVIVNGWVVKTCLQALIACRRYGVPCIVRGEVNGLRPRAAWKRFLHRILLNQYRAFLAIGSANRAYYLQCGIPDNIIHLTPYCVENERFAQASADYAEAPGRAALQLRFGLKPDRLTLLFSGKLVEKKRPGDLFAALRSMPEDALGRVQLLIVGDGPLKADLQQAAGQLPVHFAGFLNQSEIAAAYAVADCLVLPSDHGETWGLVTNEAMACSLPAIVSDQAGCARDLITPGVTGDCYPCGDVIALAALIEKYSAAPEHVREMGLAAKQRVFEGYNFDRVVNGVLAALQQIKARRGDSAC